MKLPRAKVPTAGEVARGPVKPQPPKGPGGTPASDQKNSPLNRERELVQAEFMRLTHSVDDAKKTGDVLDLSIVAKILAAAYAMIDSRKSS